MAWALAMDDLIADVRGKASVESEGFSISVSRVPIMGDDLALMVGWLSYKMVLRILSNSGGLCMDRSLVNLVV